MHARPQSQNTKCAVLAPHDACPVHPAYLLLQVFDGLCVTGCVAAADQGALAAVGCRRGCGGLACVCGRHSPLGQGACSAHTHTQEHTGRHIHRGQHTLQGDDLLCCCICQLPRHACGARGQGSCRQMLRASLAGNRQPRVALWKQVLHVAVPGAPLPPVAAALTC